MVQKHLMTNNSNKPQKTHADVLFLLDYGATDTEALNTLIALTGTVPTQVHGLFIEDVDLLGAAALPGNLEVAVINQQVTAFTAESLAYAFAREAERKRHLLETSARRLNLTCSFQVAQGRTMEALQQAAAKKDVIIVGRPLRAGIRVRTGRDYANIATPQQNLLFVNEPWRSGSSIVLVMEQSCDDPMRATRTARAIAEREGLNLIAATPNGLPEMVKDQFDQVVHISDLSPESLVGASQRLDARLLILPPLTSIDWQILLVNLLAKLSSSLLKLA